MIGTQLNVQRNLEVTQIPELCGRQTLEREGISLVPTFVNMYACVCVCVCVKRKCIIITDGGTCDHLCGAIEP